MATCTSSQYESPIGFLTSSHVEQCKVLVLVLSFMSFIMAGSQQVTCIIFHVQQVEDEVGTSQEEVVGEDTTAESAGDNQLEEETVKDFDFDVYEGEEEEEPEERAPEAQEIVQASALAPEVVLIESDEDEVEEEDDEGEDEEEEEYVEEGEEYVEGEDGDMEEGDEDEEEEEEYMEEEGVDEGDEDIGEDEEEDAKQEVVEVIDDDDDVEEDVGEEVAIEDAQMGEEDVDEIEGKQCFQCLSR